MGLHNSACELCGDGRGFAFPLLPSLTGAPAPPPHLYDLHQSCGQINAARLAAVQAGTQPGDSPGSMLTPTLRPGPVGGG